MATTGQRAESRALPACLAVPFVVASLAFAPVVHAQGGAAAGFAWLRSQQRPDGAWGGDERLLLRDTPEVIDAFEFFAPDDPAVARALDALGAVRGATVDTEARRLSALVDHLPVVVLEAEITSLLAARAPDGGWGIHRGFEVSEALDTALALRALAGTRVPPRAVVAQALGRLDEIGNADSGFGLASGDNADVGTTAEVLRALATLQDLIPVEPLRSEVVAVLLSTQNLDGGFPAFPGGTSDVTMTALTLRALMLSRADIGPAFEEGQAFVRLAQRPDGSFGSDPYTTALAVLVLGAALPDLAVDMAMLSDASIVQGDSVDLTVRVANRGLASSAPTELGVFHGDPDFGGSRVTSTPLPALAPAEFAEFVLAIDTSLLVGDIALFVVADSTGSVAEESELNNRAVIVLHIADPDAPPPPAPPTITSAPSLSAMVGDTYFYDVEATDPGGSSLEFLLAIAPDGMIIDSVTGLITWVVPDEPGHHDVLVLVRDPLGASDSQAYAIEVVSPNVFRPPRFHSLPTSAASVGVEYTYLVQVDDPDGGTVSIALQDGPAGMTFEATTRTLRWTPQAGDEGDHLVSLIAADEEGATATQQWIVFVEADARGADLVLVEVDSSPSIVDPQTLALSGAVRVEVMNQGDATAAETDFLVFEDRDGSEDLTPGVDVQLGSAAMPALAGGAAIDMFVDVSGEVLFRNNRMFGLVDRAQRIQELREDNNLFVSGREKRFVPSPAPLDAAIELEWNGNSPTDLAKQVIVAPVVAQLNDDDGDGVVGGNDTPDIVFVAGSTTSSSMQSAPGTLRAIDGASGEVVLDHHDSTAGFIQASAQPAVVDLNDDGIPEILTFITFDGVRRIGAWRPDGTLLWRSGAIAAGGDGGAPALADLEGDGVPEIIAGRTIVNADGEVRCTGPGPGEARRPGVFGSYALAADLDLDGVQEIVAGNTAYREDCSVSWARSDLGDGWNAVGQFDSDPEPEVVLASGGVVHLLEHTGETIWSSVAPGLGSRGGAPSVGDVDGDGEPEIAIAGFSAISVIETDGAIRWSSQTGDFSSGITTPTMADLDGDGRTEVIYADEDFLRIYRGVDGSVLFAAANRSGTLVEYPTVADVDGDGRVEIVVATNQVIFGGPIAGIRVFGDDNWAPGRSLWNQYNYHFTNVRCDQTVASPERPSWQLFGTYREGHAVPEDRELRAELRCPVAGTADLTASFLRFDRFGCPTNAAYRVRVGNGGEASVPPGVSVQFMHAPVGAPLVDAGRAVTTVVLAPGEFEDVTVAVSTGQGLQTVVAAVDPEGLVADGRRDNNVHSHDTVACELDRPPTLTSLPPLSAIATEPYLYFPEAIDPDNDILRFELLVAPDGMELASSAGPVQWIPTPGQVGEHRVTLRASDGVGGFDVQEWIVTVAPAAFVPPAVDTVQGIALTLDTDRLAYGPEETVLLAAQLTNLFEAGRGGTFRIDVFDATDSLAATPLPETTTLFLGAESREFVANFSTQTRTPGTYVARATYAEGDAVITDDAPFEILPDRNLVADITTGKVVYGANEDVLITSAVENTGLNAQFVELVLSVEIPGSTTPLFTETFASFDLGPGAFEERLSAFDTATTAPGDYVVKLTVREGGEVVAVDDTTFTIASSTTSGVALRGTLAVEPATVSEGSDVTLTADLTNVGNVDLGALNLLLRVLDPEALTYPRAQATVIDLGQGESATVFATFETAGLRLGSQIGTLDGSMAGTRTLVTLFAPFTVVDTTPPHVTIDAPACTSSDVTPVVVVDEAHPDVELRFLDGIPFDGTIVIDEGAHRFKVVAIDTSGNRGEAETTFVIDRTDPVIRITGVTDGQVSDTAVVPVVTLDEPNLTEASLTLNGEPFLSGSTVDRDGSYVLVATAFDCAGNASSQTVAFEVRRVAGDLVQVLSLGPGGQPRVLLGLDCVGGAGSDCAIGEPTLLRETLADAGIEFVEAIGHAAWERAVRSGRFDVHVLYRPRPSPQVPYSELNEAVWLCEGLVPIKPDPNALPDLRESLGLDWGGAVPGGAINVTLFPPLGTGILPAEDADWLRLGDAEQAATAVVGSHTRVLAASHGVGLGRTVSIAWDPERSEPSALYLDAIEATAPTGLCTLLPGGFADIQVFVTNTGIRSTEYTVSQTLDSALSSPGSLTHSLTIAPGQTSSFGIELSLPDASGSYAVTGVLEADGRVLDTDVLMVVVDRDRIALSDDVVAALDSLVLSGADSNRRDRAIDLVEQAALRSDPEDAIRDVLEAIAMGRQIGSADVSAVRIELARLLRVYQLRWQP